MNQSSVFFGFKLFLLIYYGALSHQLEFLLNDLFYVQVYKCLFHDFLFQVRRHVSFLTKFYFLFQDVVHIIKLPKTRHFILNFYFTWSLELLTFSLDQNFVFFCYHLCPLDYQFVNFSFLYLVQLVIVGVKLFLSVRITV